MRRACTLAACRWSRARTAVGHRSIGAAGSIADAALVATPARGDGRWRRGIADRSRRITRLPGNPQLNLDDGDAAKSLVAEVNAIRPVTGFTLHRNTEPALVPDPAANHRRVDPARPPRSPRATDAIAMAGPPHPAIGGVALTLARSASTGAPRSAGGRCGATCTASPPDVGSRCAAARHDDADAQQVLVDRVDQQRASASGVSVDEDDGDPDRPAAGPTPPRLILIQVAQDMMDDVLQMVWRLVAGRAGVRSATNWSIVACPLIRAHLPDCASVLGTVQSARSMGELQPRMAFDKEYVRCAADSRDAAGSIGSRRWGRRGAWPRVVLRRSLYEDLSQRTIVTGYEQRTPRIVVGFWRRFFADSLDAVVLGVAGFTIGYALRCTFSGMGLHALWVEPSL